MHTLNSHKQVLSWALGTGLALALGAWTCPLQAQQDQSQATQNQSQTQPGQQGNWGPAGPPPDAQNGQIPSQPPADAQGAQAGQQNPDGQAPPAAPADNGYGAPPPPNAARPPYNPNAYSPNPGQPPPPPQAYGGQQPQAYGGQPQAYGGQQYSQPPAPPLPTAPVTIAPGTAIAVRTSGPLDTKKLKAGDYFAGTVARDVYFGNALAIPRGAEVTGKVVDVKKPGALSGGAGLVLQITTLNLSGHAYPLVTDTWSMNGPGKGGYTAGTTVGTAALGAALGAIAGGGPGAAIGAAAGTGVGLGASAATPGPRGVLPPEALLSFHLTQPVTLEPVSLAEVQQLERNSAPPPQQGYPGRRPVGYYPYPPPAPYPYPYAYAYPYGYPYPYYYRYRYWR